MNLLLPLPAPPLVDRKNDLEDMALQNKDTALPLTREIDPANTAEPQLPLEPTVNLPLPPQLDPEHSFRTT